MTTSLRGSSWISFRTAGTSLEDVISIGCKVSNADDTARAMIRVRHAGQDTVGAYMPTKNARLFGLSVTF
jgi:hypothetical protein